MKASFFQQKILTWLELKGRKNLPWQQPITPYRVWVSEIMLQQTQVTTVIPYFQKFIHSFPNIQSLAEASLDEVLHHWAGLGYYARARNLHKSAQIIHQQGYFPNNVEDLIKLSGIGLSTAGAISSIAFNNPAPILDGNVRRVLTRFHAITGWVGTPIVSQKLWALSQRYTPDKNVADYTQAMMDLGATLCTRTKPQCDQCPLSANCQAYAKGTVLNYPTPKPKKIKPVKSLVFLLLYHKKKLLLEKRAPTGIWGGLYSLPEFSNTEAVQDWCLANNIKIQTKKNLTPLRHTFSHYHLDYSPLVITCGNPKNIVMENKEALWYNSAKIKTLALPAPIKKLIQHNNGY